MIPSIKFCQRTIVTTQQQANAGMAWGLVGVLIFSVSLPMTRVAVASLDPVFVGSARALLAGVLSVIALLITRSPWPTWDQLRRLAITASCVTVGFPIFSSIAMKYVPAGHGSVVNGLLPLATVALGAVVLHYRLRWQFWVAAATGSCIAVGVVLWNSGAGVTIGDSAMIAAVLIAAVGYVFGGKLAGELGGWRTICWANVIAAPVLIWPTLALAPTVAVPMAAWLALSYLGVFSMFFGFFAWYHGLALGGIPRVSQIQLLQSFLTMMWAWPIDGEVPSPVLLLASVAVMVCIWLARRNATPQ
jgi:drug/metabolite transporter (DMT)-like permease